MLENTVGTVKNGQSRKTGNIGYIDEDKYGTQKHNTICVGLHYAQPSTNNVNKTRALCELFLLFSLLICFDSAANLNLLLNFITSKHSLICLFGDIFIVNNHIFLTFVKQIYPEDLTLNKANNLALQVTHANDWICIIGLVFIN